MASAGCQLFPAGGKPSEYSTSLILPWGRFIQKHYVGYPGPGYDLALVIHQKQCAVFHIVLGHCVSTLYQVQFRVQFGAHHQHISLVSGGDQKFAQPHSDGGLLGLTDPDGPVHMFIYGRHK